ncbi:MFS transporter [Arthrobacter sp. MMS18-M83]|uniref:MFS transporter n=1 Tax=Arthrobacter sp. MMS18-M83 TaxID=2996261 RepID=UPI00227AF6CB|nr:MFS transporter [Arthrobacter sp. MMS18-M83]WAH97341.1 hypothetical protein OW521_00040 [Arthrobacter sp. MMS18-M83]
MSIGIVRDELPGEKVSVTIGLLSAIFGIGAGVGILAAGPIVEKLDWHWLFWFPLVLVVIALLGTIFGMPRTIGSSVGTAIIAALISSHSTARGLPTNDAFTIGFWACAAVAVLAIIGSLAAPSIRKRRQQAIALGIEDLPVMAGEAH